MPGYVKLASLEELPPGTGREFEHGGRIIALFHEQDGRVFALDGICAHQGGPLARGEVKSGVVTCPWHGWQFSLTSGQCLIQKKVKQAVFDVQIEGQDILVLLP